MGWTCRLAFRFRAGLVPEQCRRRSLCANCAIANLDSTCSIQKQLWLNGTLWKFDWTTSELCLDARTQLSAQLPSERNVRAVVGQRNGMWPVPCGSFQDQQRLQLLLSGCLSTATVLQLELVWQSRRSASDLGVDLHANSSRLLCDFHRLLASCILRFNSIELVSYRLSWPVRFHSFLFRVHPHTLLGFYGNFPNLLIYSIFASN